MYEWCSAPYLYVCVSVSQVVPSAPAAGDTDYSDPFDAHPNPWPESDLGHVPCENNGYMEPYEAQRVITGESVSRLWFLDEPTISLSQDR